MPTLTELQALDAMIIFLRDHAHGSHTLADLLEEISYGHISDGEPMTPLPGVWYDWQQAVKEAVQPR